MRTPELRGIIAADFSAGILLPPNDGDHQQPWEDTSTLPRDGLPRITTEGVRILAEGLRGDFRRWVWTIGNHPLEIPREHVRNVRICAMDDRPHFVAHAYTGIEYPQTKKGANMIPWYCFDELDTMITKYHTEDPTSIHLRQTADYWAYLPILTDSNDAPKSKVPEEIDDEDDGMEECPLAEKKAPAACSLDAWIA